MRLNKTKQKLQQGNPVAGIISTSTDPMFAELSAFLGFDYYMIDAEHGPFTPAQAIDIIRACEATDITPLARVGQKDAKLVLQYLDAGMMGIMMPGLESAAEVQMLVDAVKYRPLGKRGLSLTRAADYLLGEMSQAEYVHFANEQTLVWPQFEDVALLEQLPAMSAVDGVDGIVIGPRDLALTMGYPDGFHHDEVQQVINQAITIINNQNRSVGITAGTAEAVRQQIGRGAQIILTSIPNLLKQSGRAFLEGLTKRDNPV